MAHPKGYVKSEHPGAGGGKRDGYTPETGAALVAKVMGKAEASHASGSKTTEGRSFKLEPNQAKHTSIGTEDFGSTSE